MLCSTPEGIGAGITLEPTSAVARASCAQRPKASERELLAVGEEGLLPAPVLNARRHRSGNCPQARPRRHLRGARRCSTPEGIGAGITSRIARHHPRAPECSTPEGIGAGITARCALAKLRVASAQRPKASERELPPTTVFLARVLVGAQRPKASERELPCSCRARRTRWRSAQRPKASERELPSLCALVGLGFFSAQRPKASERELRVEPRGERAGGGSVLNARRHRSGNYTIPRFLPDWILRRAQRPKASERELLSRKLPCGHICRCSTPEGIGAGITA